MVKTPKISPASDAADKPRAEANAAEANQKAAKSMQVQEEAVLNARIDDAELAFKAANRVALGLKDKLDALRSDLEALTGENRVPAVERKQADLQTCNQMSMKSDAANRAELSDAGEKAQKALGKVFGDGFNMNRGAKRIQKVLRHASA